jgi:hypothetical protein
VSAESFCRQARDAGPLRSYIYMRDGLMDLVAETPGRQHFGDGVTGFVNGSDLMVLEFFFESPSLVRARPDTREDICRPAASTRAAEWPRVGPQAPGAMLCAQDETSRPYPKPINLRESCCSTYAEPSLSRHVWFVDSLISISIRVLLADRSVRRRRAPRQPPGDSWL